MHVSRVKLTEEDRKRLALKKKEQASKLSWNDGDGEGVGMRIVVLKGVFHPDDARATYNFYEEVALGITLGICLPSPLPSFSTSALFSADTHRCCFCSVTFAAARGDRRYNEQDR